MPDRHAFPPLPPLPRRRAEHGRRERVRAPAAAAAERPGVARGGRADAPRRRRGAPATRSSSACSRSRSGCCSTRPGSTSRPTTSPDGWQRDVALAFTGPLADVSHALLLDRPRKARAGARSAARGADEIDTEIALPVADRPPTGAAAEPTTAAATPRAQAAEEGRRSRRQRKLRLWVAGDSLVITPGYAVVRAAGASPVIESVGGVDGRVATGLTRPDVFNWFEQIRTQRQGARPRAVVLGFGGNDDKAYMTGLPEGVSIDDFGGSAWRREYARRVGGLMDVINRAGGFVVWIGLPQTQLAGADAALRRRSTPSSSRRRGRREGAASFIDTYTMFAGGRRRLHRVPARRLRSAWSKVRAERRRAFRARGRRHDRP